MLQSAALAGEYKQHGARAAGDLVVKFLTDVSINMFSNALIL